MHVKTLWCPYCLEYNVQGKYEVSVDDDGGLYVSCDIHEEELGGPFLSIANEAIAGTLKEIAQTPCSCCGDEEDDEEPDTVVH